jgi:hypothetical protein
MTKLKKHNGTKHPGVQPVNDTKDHSTSQPQGGHPMSNGGSRQGNVGHDYSNTEGGNRQVKE